MTGFNVLLFSAGIDSFVSWHLLKKPKTYYCAVGHKYQSVEIDKVKRCVHELEMDAVIDGRLSIGDWERVEDSVIPLRNVLLAEIACVATGADTVWLGIPNGEAGAGSRDKSHAFRTDLGRLLTTVLGRPIEIKSALDEYTKAEAVGEYIRLTGDVACHDLFEYTVGCYQMTLGSKHCGKCYACFKRWACFRLNGVDNLFEYQSDPRKWQGISMLEIKMRTALANNDFSRYGRTRILETLRAIESIDA